MEFEFKRTFGQYSVQCSMGHEIVGRWLQEEIGRDPEKLTQVSELIEQAYRSSNETITLPGTEISLSIESGEVVVQENAMLQQSDEEMEPDFDFYDCESSAVCGLEDFALLIERWQRFLKTGW